MSIINGKNIIVGVTGGIAAYKSCELVRGLIKKEATVQVVMTKNATEFHNSTHTSNPFRSKGCNKHI